MARTQYKILRIYPGLQTEYPLKIGGFTFQKLEDSDLEEHTISKIKNALSVFKVDKWGQNKDEVTLADKPLLTTTVLSADYESFNESISPYESVLYFIANLSSAYPPIQENINFYILNKGGITSIGGKNTLKLNTYNPKEIFISQFQFIQSEEFLQCKLLHIFAKMNNQIFEINLSKKNLMVGNQFLIASLYWFNKGCIMRDLDEEKTAIIFFAIAFEAFFNINNTQKKESLANAIQRYLGDDSRLRRWTRDFYETRNRIVHGGNIIKSELRAVRGSKYLHSQVAKHIMLECILRQLYFTDGLDYSREDMDASYEFIIGELLTLNEDKFNKLKIRKQFSYENISNHEYIAKEFFKTLHSINPNEEFAIESSAKSSKNYFDLTKNLSIIVVDWLNDAIKNEKFPIFYAPIDKDKSGIDIMNYPDELKIIIGYFENYNPNEANDIFNIWENALSHYTKIYLRNYPYFNSPYKGLGLYDILDFGMKTAIRLG